MTDTPSQKKNPKWTRQETILALELYLREPGIRYREPEDPAVLELSQLLNEYHQSIGTPQTSDLRNPNGVSMKLGNFMRLDPEFKGSGLMNGARLEEEVWSSYANDRDLLHREAALLAEHIRADSPSASSALLPDLESDEELESEGDPRTYAHRSYERKSGNRKKKIDSIKKRDLPIDPSGGGRSHGDVGTGSKRPAPPAPLPLHPCHSCNSAGGGCFHALGDARPQLDGNHISLSSC